MWVGEQHREEAMFQGFTVVDAPTVITTHLNEIIRDNMSELLSYSETQKLLDELDGGHQKLIADLVLNQINIAVSTSSPEPPWGTRFDPRPCHHPRRCSHVRGYTRNIGQLDTSAFACATAIG